MSISSLLGCLLQRQFSVFSGFIVASDSFFPHEHTPQSLGQENACFMNEFRALANFSGSCDILSAILEQMGFPKNTQMHVWAIPFRGCQYSAL